MDLAKRSPTPPAMLLHPGDSVAVATRGLQKGDRIALEALEVTAVEDIPPGHKLAVRAVTAGTPVLKFGQAIGLAAHPIASGDWVHTHNLSVETLTSKTRVNELLQVASWPPPLWSPPAIVHRFNDQRLPSSNANSGPTFQGYLRPDGAVGTRNYVAIISSVNCSASVSKFVARKFTPQVMKDFPHVDGVLAFTHTGGCAMEFGGECHQMLARVLAGYARHPNIASYLLIGLGCETGTIGHLLQDQGLVQLGATTSAPPVLSMQDCGGTAATIDAAYHITMQLLYKANQARRTPAPASKLVLGLNCGGSDGYSGITANPALGVASDLLVAFGGTTALAETTEIYGAEQLLVARSTSRETAAKLLERIAWWERYTAMFGCTPDNNPSPGNKEGGLSTILEKSLGAVTKGGTSPLTAVYEYAQPIRERGFVFMDTPGFDPTSVTGLVAGGCNLVAFTTGRGSCFGCKPAPSLKIASNSRLYEKMKDDMDVDAGRVLSGASLEEVGAEIFQRLLAVASGEPTKSERLGLGEEEFSPWNIGPIL